MALSAAARARQGLGAQCNNNLSAVGILWKIPIGPTGATSGPSQNLGDTPTPKKHAARPISPEFSEGSAWGRGGGGGVPLNVTQITGIDNESSLSG